MKTRAEELTQQDVERIREELLKFEKEFVVRHGRKPHKEDLKALDEDGDARRSSRIYEYYILYAQWKKLQQQQQQQQQQPPPAAATSNATTKSASTKPAAAALRAVALAPKYHHAGPQRKLTVRQKWEQQRLQEAAERERKAGSQAAAVPVPAPARASSSSTTAAAAASVILCSPDRLTTAPTGRHNQAEEPTAATAAS